MGMRHDGGWTAASEQLCIAERCGGCGRRGEARWLIDGGCLLVVGVGGNDFLAYVDDLPGVHEHHLPNNTDMTANEHIGQLKVLSNKRVCAPS